MAPGRVVALVASGAIETWQAVSAGQRNGDVNDVLLNTTGALVGAWVVAAAARWAGSRAGSGSSAGSTPG
jgi:VanZ family protein